MKKGVVHDIQAACLELRNCGEFTRAVDPGVRQHAFQGREASVHIQPAAAAIFDECAAGRLSPACVQQLLPRLLNVVWGGGVRTRARSEGFTMLVPGDKVSARLFNGIVAQHEGHMPLLQHLDIDGTSKGLDVGCKVPHGSNKLIERSSNAPAIHLDGYGHGKRVRGKRRWRWRQDRRRRQRQRQR